MAKQKAKEARKSWSLTALAAEFDIPFKTAMSYRRGYCRIEPDVKVPGISKRQFSAKQVAKFLAARLLFSRGIPKEVVQAFFAEMDWWDQDGLIFADPSLLPDPLKDLREVILDSTFLVTFNPITKDPYFIVNRGENEAKFNDLIQTASDAGWPYALLSLGMIRDELWGTVQAHYRCMEFTPKSPGQKVAEALAAYQKEHVRK